MPVSNEHLRNTVQVWDGLSFTIVNGKEANKLVKAGTHQISTNLDGSKLKSAAEFNEVRETRAASDAKKPKKKDGSYKTRQMKAKG